MNEELKNAECGDECAQERKPVVEGRSADVQIAECGAFLSKGDVPYIAVFFNGEKIAIATNIGNEDIIAASIVAADKVMENAGRKSGLIITR